MAVSDQQRLGERYELRQTIGIGGMARVYLAHDRLLNRDVAVKVLNPALAADPAFVERFRREAQAAAALNHPNIVTIFDTGATDDTYYIVMEYVPGPNLKEIVRAQGPMPEDTALAIGAQIAAALDAAHRHGLIHRDIKPHNVLLPPGGPAKVTDFGIARAAGASHLTATQAVMGTAQYIAPEQALHQPVDARSDLYSLGVVLYELLAGHPPFAGDSPVAVAMQQVHDPPPPLRAVRPAIAQATEAVVVRALAKNPDARFQTAEEMRAALENARLQSRLAGETTSALPIPPSQPPTATRMLVREPSVPAPTVRRERRSRAPWIALALIPALAALALIGFFVVRAVRGGPIATATPGAPTSAAASLSATATLVPTATRTVAPSPTSPPAPTAIPAVTAAPTRPAAVPTVTAALPTPTPLAQPTPRTVPPTATAAPSPTPASQAPAAANASPDQAVRNFYALAAAHNYDAAARLWSPRQQAAYPPGEYINGRFDATQAIAVNIGNVQVDAGEGRATVAVDIVETRSDGTRHYVGTWQCVRTASGWLLDNPDLQPA